MTATLRHLLGAIPAADMLASRGDLDAAIDAPVVESSQDVQPGSLFVARRGQASDGHDFIPAAIEAGAAAIIGEMPPPDIPVPYVQVKSAQAILGPLAAAWHGFPSRKLVIIGVTGTDGKTSVCHLLHSILKRAPHIKAGYISTISADFGAESAATGLHVTTPGAPQVQAYLAKMAASGLTHCILEMTSHGLAQGRLNGVDIDVAVLTNVMHEHLDYHGSWEEYRAAKAIMFEMLCRSQRKPKLPKTAIINADDPSADFFAAIPAERALKYGVANAADFQATSIRHGAGMSGFYVGRHALELRLRGSFNIDNALAAVAAARALGVDWSAVAPGIAAVKGIPGRMESIDLGQDFSAIVDFAHTPNALKRALNAGRELLLPGKRLLAVFGSAGLRDVEKRRLMAETAAQLADMTILTAEDPRSESLDAILDMMAQGCRAAGGIEGRSFLRVPDRGQAIFHACQLAQCGDLVMALGKGHEQSMCFGETEYAWDDREAMRAALRGQPLTSLPTARSPEHAPR